MITMLKYISFFLAICGVTWNASAQIDSIKTRFDRYRIDNPQEKIYIHTDQELYLTGETLWMKIYCVEGATHLPSDLSKVAYIEVLDGNNIVVLQTKVELQQGLGKGTLFIPASLNSGNYQLRAYTQWMKNFSPDFFFLKKVPIVNAFRAPEAVTASKEASLTVRWYPEGGHLVYGLESKIAFKVSDQQGKGVPFTGVILNEENDTLVHIQPQKFGMGHFRMKAIAGSYRAVITDSLGRTHTSVLPRPKDEGIVMQLHDSLASDIVVDIARSSGSSIHSLFYVIHARQIVAAAGGLNFKGDKASLVIPRQQLQEGINHITLFDDSMQPVVERLYFIQGTKKLAVDATPLQKEFGVRRKVTIDVTASNIDKTGEASLSVSVFKNDSLQPTPSGNLFQYLWLTSDLQGSIELSDFNNFSDSDDAKQALDQIMLTHGWRRFDWSEVLSGKKTQHAFIPEYRGHLVRAKVLKPDGTPASGIATYLSSPNKIVQLYAGRSNSKGEVQFEMKDFHGPRKVIVTANTAQDSTVKISIENPFSNASSSRIAIPLQLDKSIAGQLRKRSVAMQVQDIYYGENSLRYGDATKDSSAFYGRASQVYYLDDYTRFPVMEEVMREYVPGVMVRKRRDGFHFLVLDNVRKSVFRDDPLVLLDGVPVFDIDRIMEFDPLKVKKLDVITSRYYLGPIMFPGIVSYSTYNGDLAGFEVDPKSITVDYEGLQRNRVFHAPDYDNEKQRQTRMPDRRYLLWWEPDLRIDENGKAQLEFYTSDLTGQYTILVEGLTENGYTGSAISSFTVKNFSNQ